MTSLAFDYSPAFLSDGGVGVYARDLFAALQEEKASTFTIFPLSVREEVSRKKGLLSSVHAVCRKLYEDQYLLPREIAKSDAELFHGTAFTLPFYLPVKSVVTVHDMAFLRYPHFFLPRYRHYLKLFFASGIRKADRIITVSRFTAQEIVFYYPDVEEKIRVVHSGISERFKPLPTQEVEVWREKKGLPERFLLFVGSMEPRKNLFRLLEAFSLYLHESAEKNLFLVLAGGKGWLNEGMEEVIHRLDIEKHIVRTGFLATDELPFLYNAAEVFLFPSLYEGFGFPPLEAMACGTPVLCSATASLPEICRDAGCYCDPYDIKTIKEGIAALTENPALCEELSEKGKLRASCYTWQHCAGETLKVYREALG